MVPIANTLVGNASMVKTLSDEQIVPAVAAWYNNCQVSSMLAAVPAWYNSCQVSSMLADVPAWYNSCQVSSLLAAVLTAEAACSFQPPHKVVIFMK
jgi:hypothetical protein